MGTGVKRREDLLTVKQYITDPKGHKVAAVIGMEELDRLKGLIEDVSDLKAIKERKNEPVMEYETYSKKRKSRPVV